MYNTSKQTLHESLNVKIKMAKKRKVRLEKKERNCSICCIFGKEKPLFLLENFSNGINGEDQK